MPVPPTAKTIVGTAKETETQYHYTTQAPDGDWFAIDYSTAGWQAGRGGLGTRGTPNAPVGTRWDSDNIWVRRTFQISQELPNRVALRIWHDEDAEVYLNGKWVAKLGGYTTDYESIEIPRSSLRQGSNVLAIHCRQTTGGQFLDCGIDALIPADSKSRE
jgi:hypothetical protein